MDIATILKWVTQVAVLLVSAWALWDGRTTETLTEAEGQMVVGASARRHLTAHGLARLGLLIVTFALFILSDINQRRSARADADTMRRLFLAQYKVSRISFGWTPDAETLDS